MGGPVAGGGGQQQQQQPQQQQPPQQQQDGLVVVNNSSHHHHHRGSSPYSSSSCPSAQGASFHSAATAYLPPPAPAPPDPYDRYLLHQHNSQHHHHSLHHHNSYLHHDSRYDNMASSAARDRVYDSYQPPAAVVPGGPGDPYMRRDLGYHHHYRLPPCPPYPPPGGPYTPQGGGGGTLTRRQPQQPRRCCSSASSSAVTNYHHHHHHHSHHHHAAHHGGSLQSPLLTPRSSPGLRGGQGPSAGSQQQQQTSSGSSSSSIVEYLGSSGGRYVSTTPPLSSQSRCVNSDVTERLRAMTSCSVNNDVTDRLRAMTSPGLNDVTDRLRAMTSSCGNSDVNDRLRAMTASCGNNDVTDRLRAMTSSAGQLCCTPRRPQQILAPAAQQQSNHHNSVWRSVGQSPPSPTPPSAPSAASISPPPAPTSPGVMEPISPVPMQQPPPPHHHPHPHHHHYHHPHHHAAHHQPPLQLPPVPTTVQLPTAAVPQLQPQQATQPTPPLPAVYQRSISVPVTVPVTGNGDQEPVMLRRSHQLQHQQSMPVTQEEVVATRRRVYPTASMTELVKNYIKRETAVFFGVDESSEEVERARWLERRKRLATRKYGQLRQEYQLPAASGLAASAGGQASGPASAQPDVLPTGRDELDSSSRTETTTTQLRRKPSVAKMTFSGVAYVVATLSRHKPRQTSLSRQMSRSYPPSTVPHTPTSPLDDEVFFDRVSASDSSQPTTQLNGGSGVNGGGGGDYTSGGNQDHSRTQWTALASDIPDTIDDAGRRDRLGSWRRAPPSERERAWVGGEGVGGASGHFGASRIHGQILDTATDNSNRRQYGMGVVGRFFGRSLKRSVMNREPVRTQLEDLEDHRPFFTYWVTTVQILILLISLWCYGLGPVGIHLTHQSGLVLVTSLSLQQVEYMEPANFWIGPRAADLIHLGAKFAPCMRKDAKIMKEIEKEREKERETACCIRNDDSGCVQSSKQDCSDTISTWKKWSAGDSGPGGRLSGSVCGLDPKYCEAPASIAPYEWPDDITKWPICRKSYPPSGSGLTRLTNGGGGGGGVGGDKLAAEHMVCEVIGHPCCIGIHGKCEIKTREYCDFVHGYFHEEASLCSQVSCLDNVCGMIPFYSPEVPDQFYRLWTSLFLHAGVLHLAITLVIQWFLMRDLEKLTGSLRIMIIYMGSGVAGNLASAIFVPYRAEVGPAGGQFGLLACLIVEVLNCWPMLRHPQAALAKLFAITALLFLFGLLPWIDNFAHLFGFLFGFLLSYALLPFVSFGDYDRQKKIFLIWVCLLVSALMLLLLLLLFYVIPIYDCQACSYLTCLPLTRDLCATQNINLKRSGLDVGPISGNQGDSPHSASAAAV